VLGLVLVLRHGLRLRLGQAMLLALLRRTVDASLYPKLDPLGTDWNDKGGSACAHPGGLARAENGGRPPFSANDRGHLLGDGEAHTSLWPDEERTSREPRFEGVMETLLANSGSDRLRR